MSKKLDTTTIADELEGSAFFPRHGTLAPPTAAEAPPLVSPENPPPPIEAQPAEVEDAPTLPTQPGVPLPGDPYARTPVRRTISRYAFEIFQDQIESLRRFSIEEKVRGEKGSMSRMVREAIDAYLAKRNRTDG